MFEVKLKFHGQEGLFSVIDFIFSYIYMEEKIVPAPAVILSPSQII